MSDKTKNSNSSSVDKSLVTMFLKMTPEERLQMNDNSASTILELRSAYKQPKLRESRVKLNT